MNAKMVLATHNAHKVAELRAILAEGIAGFADSDVASASQLKLPDVAETGVTFAENSLIKARAAVQATGIAAIADDSGLAVDVLGGAPGVFSARWSGKHGDDRANNELLLAQLRDVPAEHRGAQFVCAAALVLPGGQERVHLGELAGELLTAPAGLAGFGYDPIFQPHGYHVSTAEMSAADKNAISHRGKAFRLLANDIAELVYRQD